MTKTLPRHPNDRDDEWTTGWDCVRDRQARGRPYALDRAATLAQIADQLGVTQERVRQLEASGLRKCSRWCKARGLALEDLLPNQGAPGSVRLPGNFDDAG